MKNNEIKRKYREITDITKELEEMGGKVYWRDKDEEMVREENEKIRAEVELKLQKIEDKYGYFCHLNHVNTKMIVSNRFELWLHGSVDHTDTEGISLAPAGNACGTAIFDNAKDAIDAFWKVEEAHWLNGEGLYNHALCCRSDGKIETIHMALDKYGTDGYMFEYLWNKRKEYIKKYFDSGIFEPNDYTYFTTK